MTATEITHYARITFADGTVEYRPGLGSAVAAALRADGISLADVKVAPRSVRDHGPMPVEGAEVVEDEATAKARATYFCPTCKETHRTYDAIGRRLNCKAYRADMIRAGMGCDSQSYGHWG